MLNGVRSMLGVAVFGLLVAVSGGGAQPLIHASESVPPDTAYLMREDGSVFATVFVWAYREDDRSTWYILFTDSALVQSRIAHAEAENAAHRSGTFDERVQTRENDHILKDIKERLKKR